jgi:multisubunit Na+/H+ antiporter MnhC subunit
MKGNMNGIKLGSFLLIAAGVFIMIFPDIIQYIIAITLIVIGINGLTFGGSFSRPFKVRIKK